jgi:hypothetical protein
LADGFDSSAGNGTRGGAANAGGAAAPADRSPRRGRRRLGVGLALLAAAVLSGCAVGHSAPPSGVGAKTATLNGSVSSAIDETADYWFAYGQSPAYGSETTHHSIAINDRSLHPVSESLSGLRAATTYHYQACAQTPGFQVYCGKDQSFTTDAPSQLSIEANPAIYPDFDPAVSDYVTRCGASPVTMSVEAPSGTTVSIDGQPGQSGVFDQDVALTPGQAFNFTTTVAGNTSTFHVRCLPADFPAWTYARPGTPSANFYVVTPQGATTPGGQPAGRYVIFFDDHGVPVWWEAAAAVDAKVLPDGNLAWYTQTAGGTSSPGYEERDLNGNLVHTWRTVGTPTDTHDFQILPNGDALMLSYSPRPGTIDLSPYGGPSTNATVTDAEIQEIAPDGSLVWSWNTKDHIPPDETVPRWWGAMPIGTLADGRRAYDYAHINSIQVVGNTIVASFRHFDAVYAINRTTGDIVYKLGGTARPESLQVLDDPQSGSPLGGQHFARVLPDGSLTIHDNNTFLTPAPRAVRYRIDGFAGTAQLLEQVSDPDVPTSFCCGSAQRLEDGSWVMSWGGTSIVTEFGPGGGRDFKLTVAGTSLSYRVAVVTGASPSIADLRAGMDAMAPQAAGAGVQRARSAGGAMTAAEKAALGLSTGQP